MYAGGIALTFHLVIFSGHISFEIGINKTLHYRYKPVFGVQACGVHFPLLSKENY